MNILIIHNSKDAIRSQNILDQFASQETKYDYQIIEAVWNPDQPAVGTLKSFKKCIEIAIENGYPEVLILEDDFLCLCDFSLDMFMNRSKDDEILNSLLLGGIYEGKINYNSKHKEQNPYTYWAKVEDKLSGLHACIIPSCLYDTFLKAEQPLHLDYWLSMVVKVPIYVIWPMMILQNNFKSVNNNDMKLLNENLHLKYKLIGK